MASEWGRLVVSLGGEVVKSLFLKALGVKDHLLLSLNETDRFCELLCL